MRNHLIPASLTTLAHFSISALLRTAKVMQRTPTILACVYGLFVVAICCITYVAFYNIGSHLFRRVLNGLSSKSVGSVLNKRPKQKPNLRYG